MKTERQLGHNGTTTRGLSPIAQALVKQSAEHFNTDYGNVSVDELGVGGPNFHNPSQKEEVEHGRM